MTSLIDTPGQHNIDAERALIGAILDGYRSLEEVADLKPGYFADSRHAQLWRAIRHVWSTGGNPEPLAVWEALGPWRTRLPGPEYLHDLMHGCPMPASAPYYAQQVRDAAKRRTVAETGVRLAQLADTDREPDEIVEDARAQLDDLARGVGRSGAVTAADALGEAIADLEAGDDRAVPSPWPDVNGLTGGLQPGTLVTVGARPGVGKSLVATNVAAHAALRRDVGVYLATLEMGRVEVIKRILAAEARIDLTRLIRRRVEEDRDWQEISRVHGRIAGAPLTIEDTSNVTVGAVRAGVRDASRRHPVGVVIVDYLQLMQASTTDARVSRAEQVGEITRGLKLLAREMDVCVLAMSQLNRASLQRTRPTLADLRESGSIEQDSDQVWLLSVDEEDQVSVTLEVAKNRNGPCGEVSLLRYGYYASLVSPARA